MFWVHVFYVCMLHYRLLDQEEEWKADVEATIAIKDARSKMIQMEKDEMVQEVQHQSPLFIQI